MYKSYSFQSACPYEFSIISDVPRLDARCIEIVWNAANDWCRENNFVFVQPQFVTINNKTWIFIVYKEKIVD